MKNKEDGSSEETSKINKNYKTSGPGSMQRSMQNKCQKATPRDIIFRVRTPNTKAVSWKKLEGNISPTEKQLSRPMTGRMGRFLQTPGKGDQF